MLIYIHWMFDVLITVIVIVINIFKLIQVHTYFFIILATWSQLTRYWIKDFLWKHCSRYVFHIYPYICIHHSKILLFFVCVKPSRRCWLKKTLNLPKTLNISKPSPIGIALKAFLWNPWTLTSVSCFIWPYNYNHLTSQIS